MDTDQNVMAPKVVEALLGTRFRGREFLRSPLARALSADEQPLPCVIATKFLSAVLLLVLRQGRAGTALLIASSVVLRSCGFLWASSRAWLPLAGGGWRPAMTSVHYQGSAATRLQLGNEGEEEY